MQAGVEEITLRLGRKAGAIAQSVDQPGHEGHQGSPCFMLIRLGPDRGGIAAAPGANQDADRKAMQSLFPEMKLTLRHIFPQA
ncbi:MAG: hypothetical protein A2092_18985 [Rhodobacteraceae bacterium GWE1_64_9]|nr:MAG: hypothetical protein A2092_18985 [Rhodobacteraceae bacterium GWE1_64_9]HBU16626.1 hypothetical protein [Gemmobacter sp.]